MYNVVMVIIKKIDKLIMQIFKTNESVRIPLRYRHQPQQSDAKKIDVQNRVTYGRQSSSNFVPQIIFNDWGLKIYTKADVDHVHCE